MIKGIIGNLRVGKTLTLMILGIDYHNRGYTIYSNVKSFIFNDTYITKIDDEKIPNDNSLKAELLDEIYLLDLDSRVSSKVRNRINTYILMQSGKKNIEFCYTTNYIGNVDKRLRYLTDEWIYPIVYDIYGKPYDNTRGRLDNTYIPESLVLEIHKKGTDYGYKKIIKINEDILNCYDTNEQIPIPDYAQNSEPKKKKPIKKELEIVIT